MSDATTDRAAITGCQTMEIEWRCIDIDGLRKAFAAEGEGLSDEEFARDAWDNGVREPYFEFTEDATPES